jgi:hypothetical protein
MTEFLKLTGTLDGCPLLRGEEGRFPVTLALALHEDGKIESWYRRSAAKKWTGEIRHACLKDVAEEVE